MEQHNESIATSIVYILLCSEISSIAKQAFVEGIDMN